MLTKKNLDKLKRKNLLGVDSIITPRLREYIFAKYFVELKNKLNVKLSDDTIF